MVILLPLACLCDHSKSGIYFQEDSVDKHWDFTFKWKEEIYKTIMLLRVFHYVRYWNKDSSTGFVSIRRVS